MSGVPCCALQVFARLDRLREGRAGGRSGSPLFQLTAGPARPAPPDREGRHSGRGRVGAYVDRSGVRCLRG